MTVDIFIVVIFLIITLILGLYTGSKLKSLKDFAIAHRNYSTPIMVATLFATVIGGGSTFGVAEKVYSIGILYTIVFYGAALNKILVAQIVAPKIGKFHGLMSVGDVMQKLYGKYGRIIGGISICLVSIGSVSSQVSAVGYVLDQLLGIPFYWGAIIGCSVIVTYSALGGIRSVVATDVLQFLLLIIFIPMVCSVGLNIVGGYEALIQKVPQTHFSLFQDKSTMTKAVTMFFILSLSALDPSFIQRLLLSRDIKQAIQSTKITGILSIPFFTIMGGIGLLALVINPELNPNLALPYLIDNILPVGLKGLAICGVLAAVMSTADSDLHVLGLSAVHDLLIPLSGKNFSEKTQLRIAQISTFLLGSLSIFIALNFKSIIDIMIYAFSFWGPTALIPFIAGVLGYRFPFKIFLTGVVVGSITVLFWNFFMADSCGFDGLIPGMIVNSLIFYVSHKLKMSYEVSSTP